MSYANDSGNVNQTTHTHEKKKTKILTWLDNQCNPTFMKHIRTQQSTNKNTQ